MHPLDPPQQRILRRAERRRQRRVEQLTRYMAPSKNMTLVYFSMHIQEMQRAQHAPCYHGPHPSELRTSAMQSSNKLPQRKPTQQRARAQAKLAQQQQWRQARLQAKHQTITQRRDSVLHQQHQRVDALVHRHAVLQYDKAMCRAVE